MKKNLKKAKPSWPPKNRVHIRKSSWSSFDSSEGLKKKKALKKFDFNSHGKKVDISRNLKKKVPMDTSRKVVKPLKKTKKTAKRLNEVKKKTKKKFKFSASKFEFKIFFLINIEYLSLGMTFYFIFKNLLDLSIKHLVYLITGSFFSMEFLLLTIFGFLQSFFLLKCHLGLKQNRHTNILNCICYSIQVLMLVSIGIVQFLSDMTIWDHKYFLNNHFIIELIKYVFELFFLFLCCLFKYLKLFGKIKSKD